MASKQLEYKINTKVFDELAEFRKTLPKKAPKGGNYHSFENPAGLALLGCKGDMVDTVIPLKMSGGCWDAPEITFKNMDIGLRKVLKEDRHVVGMALVRNLNWQSYRNNEAKISGDIKRQIHGFKNSFPDITKTIWVTLHNDYFRTYRVSKDQHGRIVVRETKAKGIYHDEHGQFFAGKVKKEEAIQAERKRKKEEEKRRFQAYEEARRRREENERRRMAARKNTINKELSDKKKDQIDLGNGYAMIKNNKGEYILWQVGQ
jgi:hypothetical protein